MSCSDVSMPNHHHFSCQVPRVLNLAFLSLSTYELHNEEEVITAG